MMLSVPLSLPALSVSASSNTAATTKATTMGAKELHIDLVPRGAVRNDGINKISRAALARAGATETPAPPNE
jgi:hypothetical protein